MSCAHWRYNLIIYSSDTKTGKGWLQSFVGAKFYRGAIHLLPAGLTNLIKAPHRGPTHCSKFLAATFSSDIHIPGQTSFVSATYLSSSSTLGQTLDCALRADAVDWVGQPTSSQLIVNWRTWENIEDALQ